MTLRVRPDDNHTRDAPARDAGKLTAISKIGSEAVSRPLDGAAVPADYTFTAAINTVATKGEFQ